MKLLKIHLHLSDKRCERFTEMLGHFLLTDLKFWSHHNNQKNVWFHKSRVEAKNLGLLHKLCKSLQPLKSLFITLICKNLLCLFTSFSLLLKCFFFIQNECYKEEFLVLHSDIWMNSVFKNLLLFNWLSILLRNHFGLSPINQIKFMAIYNLPEKYLILFPQDI